MNHFINIFESWQPFAVDWSVCLIKAVLIMIAGWWTVNKVCRIALLFFQKTISDKGITSFLYSIMKFSLRVILVVMALGSLGINVNSLFAAIGASLVAVGLSLKDNLSNLVSGIILVINKPIHVGDYIEIENSRGTVIKIEMLFTTLQTEDKNKTVIIPNSKLAANSITRKSEYDMSLINKIYKSDTLIEKHKEFKRYLEKEFILNNKILQLPAPEIVIEVCENNKNLIKLNIWTLNQNENNLNKDIENLINKVARKYRVNFQELTHK